MYLSMNNSIQKLLFLIPLLTQLTVFAQEVEYPCDSQIAKGKYDKANEKISKALAKEPDATVYYAAYVLYSTTGFSGYDVPMAYDYLCTSNDLFSQADEKKHEKLVKHGYSSTVYTSQYARISGMALEAAIALNTIGAYDEFLSHFSHATPDQIKDATDRRNALAFADAQSENTVAAYNKFIQKYPRATEVTQAKKARNALAYKEAESLGSINAFENFIATYPQASEVAQAQEQIYRLAYNDVQRTDSEEAYRAYAAKYPRSPYAALAIDKANSFQFIKETSPGVWQSYRQYVRNHPSNHSLVAVALMEIYNIAKVSHDVDALDYVIGSSDNALRDSCLLVLHDVYAESSDIRTLGTFYGKYDVSESCQQLKDLHAKDLAAINVRAWGSADDFIKAAAPYYSAFYALRSLVSDDLKAKKWSSALATVKLYADYFADDHCYRNLISVLEAPVDKSVKVSSLGSNVNSSKGSEYAPAISADNKYLLFCASGRKDNLGSEDIFISKKVNGVWGKAKLFPQVNSVAGNESPKSLSADGTKLMLFKSGRLCVSHKDGSGWSEPEELPKNINIDDWQSDAMISSDGRAIIFASSKKSPHEVGSSVNIYVSLLDENGDWSAPIDVGPTINTAFNDRSPVLHPDMKTLYFSSEGHGALGEMDVFMSTRLRDDSWTEWSEPVSLGKEVNSVDQECWYKISTDGKVAYFSKEVEGSGDIFSLNLPEKMRPNPVATISGKLVDTKGNPVTAEIKWEDLDLHEVVGQSQTDPEDGSFFIILPMGRNYGYFIDDDDYFPLSNNLDLSKKNENVVIENDIEIASIEDMVANEVPMPMNNLFFNVGDSTLLPTSVSELKRVASLINKLGRRVEIGGHTDDTGDELRNQVLSEARAASVKQFLLNEGCDERLLVAVGYGKSKPLASNKTADGRRRNRRVEIRFIAR